MSRERQRNSNSVLFRICKKTGIVLLVIGIPALIFITTFSVKNVEIIGAQRYTPDQIKSLVLQTKQDTNSLYLYLKYRFFDKPSLPFVEKIEIDLVDSHSINVYVYEKMVAGCIEYMGEYLYFDKDGIVVESTSERMDHVPVIKGLKFSEVILHEKIKTQKEELFDVIINLTQLIGKYELDIDTVTFDSNSEVTLDKDDITVHLGKRDAYDEPLAELKNILAEAEGMEITIDMKNYVKGTDSFIAKPKKSTE